jgi:hypothetical protein
MKVSLDVASRAEGDALKRAFSEQTFRAVAMVAGVLLELESIDDRIRVLRFVESSLLNGHGTPPAALRLTDGSPGE